jgi:hypothetical protein
MMRLLSLSAFIIDIKQNKKMQHCKKTFTRHPHSILQAARDQQNQTIFARISALVEKFIPKEKDIQLDLHWNNESEAKDKEKMYQGWNLC